MKVKKAWGKKANMSNKMQPENNTPLVPAEDNHNNDVLYTVGNDAKDNTNGDAVKEALIPVMEINETIKDIKINNIDFDKKERDTGDHNGEVIAIVSGKGGVGKTTTSANIGSGLAKAGHKVVMIDTDMGLRNLDIMFNLDKQILYTLADLLQNKCTMQQALIQDTQDPNLFLIAAAQYSDHLVIDIKAMDKLIEDLRGDFDYIIIDCPAGIGHAFNAAISRADRVVVVTIPEIPTVRDADHVIEILNERGVKHIQLIVNRLQADLVKDGTMMSSDDIVDVLATELLGQIPDDRNIFEATNNGKPLVGSNTPAGQAYQNICQRICDDSIPVLPLIKKKKGFFGLFAKKGA